MPAKIGLFGVKKGGGGEAEPPYRQAIANLALCWKSGNQRSFTPVLPEVGGGQGWIRRMDTKWGPGAVTEEVRDGPASPGSHPGPGISPSGGEGGAKGSPHATPCRSLPVKTVAVSEARRDPARTLAAVEHGPAFARDFRRLPRLELVRVERVIQSLREEPRPPGARAIRGFPGGYRIRSGQYRLVYEVKDRTLVILLLAAGHRREIYERLKRRANRRDS